MMLVSVTIHVHKQMKFTKSVQRLFVHPFGYCMRLQTVLCTQNRSIVCELTTLIRCIILIEPNCFFGMVVDKKKRKKKKNLRTMNCVVHIGFPSFVFFTRSQACDCDHHLHDWALLTHSRCDCCFYVQSLVFTPFDSSILGLVMNELWATAQSVTTQLNDGKSGFY